MKAKRILLTGANGQIGTVLLSHLQNRYGLDAVVATDIRQPSHSTGLFELLDIRDGKLLHQLAEKYQVGEIYHLAAVLSAKGESDPVWTWGVNMDGLLNVLEVARELQLKVFFPSSIAVFGDYAPRVLTSQWAPLIPATVYGISKVAGEHWCRYYHSRYGVDVRSLRFPGLISYESPPGGGTTDYAVEIYHSAVKDQSYSCFLKPDTRLPMLYMPDALRAMTQLMEADGERLRVRTSYNLAGMSFTPAEQARSIRNEMPGFAIHYQPDFRQQIADSWPESIDDSWARSDWDWKPQFGLDAMTRDMLAHLKKDIEVTL